MDRKLGRFQSRSDAGDKDVNQSRSLQEIKFQSCSREFVAVADILWLLRICVRHEIIPSMQQSLDTV
jgi:hypothetical protein